MLKLSPEIRNTRDDLAQLAERRPDLATDCHIIRDNLRLLAVRAKDLRFCRIVAAQIARLGAKINR